MTFQAPIPQSKFTLAGARSAQGAPVNCHYHRVLDRKALDLRSQQHGTVTLSQQTHRLLTIRGHFRKPKKNISPRHCSRQRGSSQAPRPPLKIFQPRAFLTYADFTRIFASEHAGFGTRRNADFEKRQREIWREILDADFLGRSNYNYQYFWQKNSTP